MSGVRSDRWVWNYSTSFQQYCVRFTCCFCRPILVHQSRERETNEKKQKLRQSVGALACAPMYEKPNAYHVRSCPFEQRFFHSRTHRSIWSPWARVQTHTQTHIRRCIGAWSMCASHVESNWYIHSIHTVHIRCLVGAQRMNQNKNSKQNKYRKCVLRVCVGSEAPNKNAKTKERKKKSLPTQHHFYSHERRFYSMEFVRLEKTIKKK